MITRAGGTDEGREQERVNTEHKSGHKRLWLGPVLLALPFLAVIGFAAYRFGPTLLRVISVLIKGAVVS